MRKPTGYQMAVLTRVDIFDGRAPDNRRVSHDAQITFTPAKGFTRGYQFDTFVIKTGDTMIFLPASALDGMRRLLELAAEDAAPGDE